MFQTWIREKWKAIIDYLKLDSLWESVTKKIETWTTVVGALFTNVKNTITGAIKTAINTVIDLINDMVDEYNSNIADNIPFAPTLGKLGKVGESSGRGSPIEEGAVPPKRRTFGTPSLEHPNIIQTNTAPPPRTFGLGSAGHPNAGGMTQVVINVEGSVTDETSLVKKVQDVIVELGLVGSPAVPAIGVGRAVYNFFGGEDE